MKTFAITACALLLPLLVVAQSKDVFRVFYLGGQSNMDGFGYTRDLPDSLTGEMDNIWIFHGNPAPDGDKTGGTGTWSRLRPGHGVGFSSDGRSSTYSDRFGIELSFARRMQQLYPGQKIALIKYSRGGTSIDSVAARNFGAWEPDFRGKEGVNQYDHFLKTLNQAFAVRDINGDGREDELVPAGILWMQGESDAQTEAIAQRYYDNLKRLMDLIRAALRVDDLPLVIGKISDSWNHETGKVWPHGELVQYAQEKLARTDVNVVIVRTTRYYKYSDPWHYDSAGYIDLGVQFAEAAYRMR